MPRSSSCLVPLVQSALLAGATSCWALDTTPPKPVPLNGYYTLYGGGLGDWHSAPLQGAKLVLEIRGNAAAKLYSELGPRAQQHECVPAEDRIRQAGDLDCVQHLSGATECHIGIDLRSGKSIPGTIC